MQKIINETRQVQQLNEEHDAVVSNTTVAGHVQTVITAVAAARQAELLEIHKGWPGSANPNTHEVFLQLFKSSSAVENRNFMWRTFQTMIHEYMHTLNHSRYGDYANRLPDRAKGHTLREGMTDYLTKVVWSTVPVNDAALHRTIEGPYHDPAAPHPVPQLSTYAAAVEAEQLVGVVGTHNAYAAYFLGAVELIGG